MRRTTKDGESVLAFVAGQNNATACEEAHATANGSRNQALAWSGGGELLEEASHARPPVDMSIAGRIVIALVSIRDADAAEAPILEALQRRSSDVWEAYREQLAANPDAIDLPRRFIDNRWFRVAVDDDRAPIGFSVTIPGNGRAHELDGLFVEPAHMLSGIGRALVEDAAARASGQGAECLEVTAGPAQGFYERVGFYRVDAAQTRFGPAVRMRRELAR